jgi:hypothetical protein
MNNWYNKNFSIKVASNILKETDLRGEIKQQDDGFSYIKVNDKIVEGFYPMIPEASKPPYFGADGIGAHVSFISSEEAEEKELAGKLKEVGKEICFKVTGLYSTNPAGWDDMKRVWFLTIEAPELKDIRKGYGLPASYNGKGHKFHITVGVQKS